jgi:hypothetical protein
MQIIASRSVSSDFCRSRLQPLEAGVPHHPVIRQIHGGYIGFHGRLSVALIGLAEAVERCS